MTNKYVALLGVSILAIGITGCLPGGSNPRDIDGSSGNEQ